MSDATAEAPRAAPATWVRVVRALHPLEWAVLAFVVYVVARAGGAALEEWRNLSLLRSIKIFTALLAVGTVHVWRKYRAAKAVAAPPPLQKALLDGLLVLAAMPLLFAIYTRFIRWNTFALLRDTETQDLLPGIGILVLQVLGFGAPTLLAWAVVALHLKEQGRLRPGPLLKESGASLASTVREWGPVLWLLAAYAWMAAVIGTPPRDYDELMMAIDRTLFFGVDPVRALQAIISVPLSEWMAFSYAFYMVLYPLAMGAVFMFGGKLALREVATALGLGLVVTYVGYTTVPVMGPVFKQTFEVPLDYWLMESIKGAMMDRTRIAYDCFPSFHTAGTLIMAWGTWRHARRLFWFLLPITVSIPFSCVYLRYHYVTDVLAGTALAAAVCWGSPRLLKWWFP